MIRCFDRSKHCRGLRSPFGLEICRFLQIARGSASELEYHLQLSRDLPLLEEEQFQKLEGHGDELERMLTALIQRFKAESIVQ
jgi:four helix bundle protein